MLDMAILEVAYRTILSELGEADREGTHRTPHRAAKAIVEMTSGYHVNIDDLFTTFDSEGYDEMVVEHGIPFVSLCEHHLLPFTGTVAIGYIPVDRVVGLSKLARLVEAFSRRLQVQERMTKQISDAIETNLLPLGSIVVIEAEHSCMSCRGVRTHGVQAVTSQLRGLLKLDAAARAEALTLMRR